MKRIILLFIFYSPAYALFAQQPKLMLPIGHTSWVNSSEFSLDGKKVVTTGDDKIVKIWDAETGRLLADLVGHAERVKCAEFSPDGKKVLTASEGGSARIWDAQTGKLLMILKETRINAAKFSPDGKKIVTATVTGIVKIWDAREGKLLWDLKVSEYWINTVQFSPDGKQVVTASFDQTAKVWDVLTGKLLADLKGHDNDVVFACFSPDGKKIVTASADGTAKIWDGVTGKLLSDLSGHSWPVTSAQFSPDGKKVVTASIDRTAKIWDAGTGKLLTDLKGHTYFVVSAVFAPDGKRIVTASDDGAAKIWDAATGKLLADLNGHTGWVNSARFSSDGTMVVTASNDGTSKIWDAATGKLIADLKGRTFDVNAAQFSADGKTILTTSRYGLAKAWNVETGAVLPGFGRFMNHVRLAQMSPSSKRIVTISYSTTAIDTAAKIWDALTGRLLTDLKGHTGTVNSAWFSPDSKKVVTSSNDSTAKIWDTETGRLLANLKGHIAGVNVAQFSADGKKILTASKDGTAKIWQAETGKLLIDLKGRTDMVQVAEFSPDGKKVVTASLHNVKTWDAKTGTLLADLKGHTVWVNSAQFSADGKKIVTASNDSTAKIWDVESGKFLTDLRGQTGEVSFARFSPDGKMIVTTADDGTAKTWDAETGRLLANLMGHTSSVNAVQYSPDGKSIITSAGDNTCKLWDAKTGRLLYTFFAVDSAGYLVTDPYGRYDGTEAARKLLYFTCGTEVIGLDQVKDQLWVPNLAERIMKGDSINAKKLSDLDICGLTPTVEQLERTGYHYQITPRRGGLGETVLLVNDIEVRRYQPAQLIKTASGYELNISELELQPYFVAGKQNPVAVKAYTAKNDIASRGTVVLKDAVAKPAGAPNLYAVMIGVSDYKGSELQLKYAAKDAEDISAAVATGARKLLNTDGREHVYMYNLTTGKTHYQLPEKIAVKNILQEIGKKATADDILLIFFAGHGVTSGEKKQFYFLTADASQKTATDAPAEVGISTQELSEWMRPAKIKAQKRILILDACNSGQAVNELVKIGGADQNYLAARNDDRAEQIKAIDKLNEKSGLFILAASASNQSAYEMGRYSQGLLTYALLKAIKQQPDILEDNKYLNVSRWFNAAEKTVSDMVRETGNRQEPQIVSAGNFNIGLIDPEVMAVIHLANEKPLFTASNFQNSEEAIADDDLEISKYVNQSMNDISARGSGSQISYVTSTSAPDAYSLSGRYEVKGDAVTIKVNIRQNKEVKYKFEVPGKKADLKALVEKVVEQATEWVGREK